jgi:hypothetical protein
MEWSLACHARESEGIVTPVGRQEFALAVNSGPIEGQRDLQEKQCGLQTSQQSIPQNSSMVHGLDC